MPAKLTVSAAPDYVARPCFLAVSHYRGAWRFEANDGKGTAFVRDLALDGREIPSFRTRAEAIKWAQYRRLNVAWRIGRRNVKWRSASPYYGLEHATPVAMNIREPSLADLV